MSAVVIEQLRGQSRDPNPRVELLGAYLPNRGVQTTVRQRVVKEQAPGADRPVVHVLGATLEPFTLEGTFNDAISGDTNGAAAVSATLNTMCAEGYPVRLVWTVDDTNLWEYTGFISEFRLEWAQGQRVIGWALTFEPIESGDTLSRLRFQAAGPDDVERRVASAVAISMAAAAVQQTAALGRLAAVVSLTRAA